ncbi:hypothetical protein ACVWZ8_004341 [Arthrobacter sp. UYCu723]
MARSNNSEKIWDARAFTVGKSKTVHHPSAFPTSIRVIGRCGVVGYSDYHGVAPETGATYETRPAVWADSAVTCRTCLRK